MDALELDVLEVLSLVRSVKNSFAPINRIPSEVLSLIPDYYRGDGADQDLIALTHVCRSWRGIFTSRSSLWTRFSFTNTDKTRTYIRRSQTSPLKINLSGRFIDDAFALIIPHISRLQSFKTNADDLPRVVGHFRCHTPLLEELTISSIRAWVLDNALFNGDLSSLRELCLYGVITNFPWKNLSNLQILNLKTFHTYGTTQILDFLESAPLLRSVLFGHKTPTPDAPPGRIVSLRHLKAFTMDASPPHSTLLRHLHIPTGASLISKFHSRVEESMLLDYLPERSPNFVNLSHITAINLLFESNKTFVRLSGPSGSLRVLNSYMGFDIYTAAHQTFRSLGPVISTITRLAILGYKRPAPVRIEHCPIFQTLSSANHLRTLILTDCPNPVFARALDPEQNLSKLVPCFNMKELVLYDKFWYVCLDDLVKMAKNRASRGAKLASITIIDLGGFSAPPGVLNLMEHVTRVEYKTADTSPVWDDVPGDG